MTRNIPNKKIREIAAEMKCHFVLYKLDESIDYRHQRRDSVDTRKNSKIVADRVVQLLTYKDHFMIDMNEKLPITEYYIQHKDRIDRKFKKIPIAERQLIKNSKGEKSEGTGLTTTLLTMFEHGFFREINQCEQGILSTCEFDNHLNDYVNLSYNEESCCKLESTDLKKITEWSHIYYAIYETDVTGSKHKPYLVCVCDEKNIASFTGDNLTSNFLNALKTNSLTYFHNLKYDACFFINEDRWETQLTQRSGTLLQVVMDQYKWIEVKDKKTGEPVIDEKTGETKMKKIREKHLTFRNSYSIIPAPLCNFDDMFKLKVHKEIIAYKIYNAENMNRKWIPFDEFYNQYRIENIDKKSTDELDRDRDQLLRNAKFAKAYKEDTQEIEIMKYAKFYCIKDCITLMDGMKKFNNDLTELFKKTDKTWVGIHQFISVIAVGYDFARIYGCFDGCYQLSGKPQNFIQRCVSGGRTITADNVKQYIADRIHDFDAISLYPSAMYIMEVVKYSKHNTLISTNTHPIKYTSFIFFFCFYSCPNDNQAIC
ncbi:hypothetical protein M9Y10_021332 [Tritrichomonas musculus]|uniref:DNA-directed DNA polymerase n=1 Tax=Tritrichomonas musculus TaxID=1915356 RepID=A0ABR2HFZ0_9EUKA